MKKTKKLVAAIVTATMIMSLTGCSMIEKTPEAVSKSVVAKVGDVKITRADVDARLGYVENLLKKQYGDDYAKNEEAQKILVQQRQSIANSLVLENLLVEKAEELKIVPDDNKINEEINAKIAKLKEQYGGEEGYKKALEEEKVSEDMLKQSIKNGLIGETLYKETTKDIKVDETEMKNHYEAYKFDYTEKPSKVELAQIVTKTEDEAKEIKKELDGGADFAKLAKEKSIDTTTKENGGSLGMLELSKIPKGNAMYAALALKPGEYTAPVQDKTGWHITKVIQKEDYPVKPFDQVKDEIQKELLQQKQDQLWKEKVTEWEKDSKVKVNEDNLK